MFYLFVAILMDTQEGIGSKKPDQVTAAIGLIQKISNEVLPLTIKIKPDLLKKVESYARGFEISSAKKLNRDIIELYGNEPINNELQTKINARQKLVWLFLGAIALIALSVFLVNQFFFKREINLFQEDKLKYAQTYPDGQFFHQADSIYWGSIPYPVFICIVDDLSLRRSHLSNSKKIGSVNTADTLFYQYERGAKKYTYPIDDTTRTDYYYKIHDQNSGETAWVFGGGVQKNFGDVLPYYEKYINAFPKGKFIGNAKERQTHLVERVEEKEQLIFESSPYLYITNYPNGKHKDKVDSLIWLGLPYPKLKSTSRKGVIREGANEKSKRMHSFGKGQTAEFLFTKSPGKQTLKVGKERISDYYYQVKKYSYGKNGWVFGGNIEFDFQDAIAGYEIYLDLLPSGIFSQQAKDRIQKLKQEMVSRNVNISTD